MREAAFIKQNKNKWIEFENVVSNNVEISPRDWSELYIDVTEDLSFAQTFYPHSKTTQYLNRIAGQAHRKIYRSKKESSSHLLSFFTRDFPLFFYSFKTELLLSFLLFLFFALIGGFSLTQDQHFARAVLGDNYVEMTLTNIENGDPMAVYKSAEQGNMFLGITINNIKVALFAFIYGILLGLGTVYILMQNGIMLGVFQYFMFQHDVGWESVLTIWIHGSIEISVIIVAGCAGLVVAKGILFPGTYKRITSFIRGVKNGLKIMLSTLPFFILAGFLEGFITRYTGMPKTLAVGIITFNFLLILFYYVFYPAYLHRQQRKI